ncbi:MAG: beta-ketoacyl-ACP synthase [Alphaproteobacteria bacterium]
MHDKKGRPVVVVTGIGVVTSLGTGKQDNWRALTAGQSNVRPITRFSTEGLRTTIAATVEFDPSELYSSPGHTLAMAQASTIEAIAQAQIGSAGHFPGPLFLATSPTELEWPQRRQLFEEGAKQGDAGYAQMLAGAKASAHEPMHALFQYGYVADVLADSFGTRGQPISLTTACASGATAIQLGVEAIRRGETDAALCVGTDGSVHPESLVRFSLLSALSTQNDDPKKAERPFSKDRSGFVMGEGAATLVLESYAGAMARGAKILGVLRGCGERADVFHRTRSSPDGSAIIATLKNTLDDADITVDDIDYINAHGTGTSENDKMEYASLSAVFGERIHGIPISSNKSEIGHTLTAAGAVEAVFSILTIQTGILPPTINYDVPDPEIPLDVVPNVKRDQTVNLVLSNSFGFGGQNVCLAISGEPA